MQRVVGTGLAVHFCFLGVFAVKASVKLENFVAGRLNLGFVCHTLQVG